MAEFLTTLAQYVSLGGYLCGAFLVIAHLAAGELPRTTDGRWRVQRPNNEDAAAWQRYQALDS